jgi:hypothetical protein
MESLGVADPRSVGGYPLFARLGAGGMGQVYLARTPAGRPLALKTVRSEFGLDPAFGERFAREIRHADRVRSPWTVAVVDYSPAGTSPQWLATEYLAAPSLSDWVSGHGPLPAASLTALAAELAEGLHAVHQAGLAHRDVKPSNVLLPGTRPLLIDFGIARAAEDSRHTRTGGVIGSPGYMAPEQATAGMSAEPGDVFALGAVLVYAATGRGPFNRPGEEPSTPALLYRVVHEDPDLDGVPEELLPLVRACLAKDTADRPTARTAAELLPAADRSAGHWSARQPPGLAAELLAREAEMRATLGEPDALRKAHPQARTAPLTAPGAPPNPGSGGAAGTPPNAGAPGAVGAPPGSGAAGAPPGSGAAGTRLGPSPYAPSAARPASYHPAHQQGAGPSAPTRAPGSRGPNSGGWGAVPAAAAGTRGPGGPGTSGGMWTRKGPLIAAATAAAVVLILAGLLIRNLRDSGSDDAASTGGGTGSPHTSAPASAPTSAAGGGPSGSPADPDALPQSWVGTWVGEGPGDPTGLLGSPRTDSFKVTLTLQPGLRGQLVGQQVSDVRDIDTGQNDGCTEALELDSIDGDTIVFAAKSPRPSDPDSDQTCLPGSTYKVTMDNEVLRLDPSSREAGSPSTFAKQ